MTHYNSGILRKIEFLLLVMALAGCVSSNKTAAPPMGELSITETLLPTLNISNTPMPVKMPTPALMTSSIPGEVVYSNIDPNTNAEQIFLKNLDTGYVTQLTNAGYNSDPIWSPDGSKIMYTTWTNRNDTQATPEVYLYTMNKDGSEKKPLLDNFVYGAEADWSPDGHQVVFMSRKDGNDEIYKINVDTQRIDRLTFTPMYAEAFPHWSPNGNNITFVASNDGGPLQVYVMDTNAKNLRQVTDSYEDRLDRDPIWCPDSDCIIYTRTLANKLMTLDLNTAEITPLLGDTFKSEDESVINVEGFPARSPIRGYITFAIFGRFGNATFYAMDMKSRKIYPLNVQALSLSLYP